MTTRKATENVIMVIRMTSALRDGCGAPLHIRFCETDIVARSAQYCATEISPRRLTILLGAITRCLYADGELALQGGIRAEAAGDILQGASSWRKRLHCAFYLGGVRGMDWLNRGMEKPTAQPGSSWRAS